MAEDLHNPLNTGIEPPSPTPPVREAEPEPANQELEDFLDDIFETRSEAETESETPPDDPPPTQAAQPTEDASATDLTQQQETPSEEPSAPPVSAPTPAITPLGGTGEGQDDLQRQVLQRLNEQLERMAHPPAEPEPQPEPITPDQLVQQLQPRVQQYIEAGWLTEDHAVLYPRETALQVYMWDQIQQGTQQIRQTTEFTEAEQQRRAYEEADRTINTAIDEVAARGEVFNALTDAEVRKGFREFLINDVNPRMSQVNAEFLARQFYAYNHQLIFDMARQQQEAQAKEQQQAQADAQTEATPTQLAQQEGSSTRGSQVTPPPPPEFAELLEGLPAAGWFQ